MVLLVQDSLVNLEFSQALLIGLLGYMVVFFGLVLLMFVIMIVGKIMVGQNAKAAAKAATKSAITVVPAEQKPAPVIPEASGTAGELKLHDVDPRTAAMVMAIVADHLGKPINELRFKSIEEVK